MFIYGGNSYLFFAWMWRGHPKTPFFWGHCPVHTAEKENRSLQKATYHTHSLHLVKSKQRWRTESIFFLTLFIFWLQRFSSCMKQDGCLFFFTTSQGQYSGLNSFITADLCLSFLPTGKKKHIHASTEWPLTLILVMCLLKCLSQEGESTCGGQDDAYKKMPL